MASRSLKHARPTPSNPIVAAYERTVAILHEQLADCRKERDAAIAREQSAQERLMQIVTATQFAPTVPPRAEPHSVRNMRRGAEESDPFREVPYGDPMASFKTPEDAALLPDGMEADLLRAIGVNANGGSNV